MRIYFVHIFVIFGLTFVAITKKHDLPVRAHVNFANKKPFAQNLTPLYIKFNVGK